MPNDEIAATTKTTDGQSEDDKLLYEWKSYLQQSRNVELLLVATESILQLHTSLLVKCIVQYDFVTLLCKHVSYDGTEDSSASSSSSCINRNNSHQKYEQVSVNALRALVYLSSNTICMNQCIDQLITNAKAMNRMIEIVLSSQRTKGTTSTTGTNSLWNTRINYAMALLANMTRTELGTIEFIGHTLPVEPIYHNTTTTASNTNTSSNNDTLHEDIDPTGATSKSSIVEKVVNVKPTFELLLNRFMNPIYIQDENVNYNAYLNMTDDDNVNDDDDDDDANDNPTHNSLTTTTSTAMVSRTTNIDNDNTNTAVLPSNHGTDIGFVQLDSMDHDPYQHFAAILLNCTSLSDLGRQFIMQIHTASTSTTSESKESKDDTKWTVLQLLLGQLKSRNPIRRRGIAGMIRNICQYERDSVWWLLNVVDINTHIMYPLAGPEELDIDDQHGLHVDLWIEGPDKVREPDRITRLLLVESILLLLSTGRAARNTMRLQRTYVILKMADLVEEYEDVSTMICDCVNYLRRDEDGTVEGSSDALIEDTYQLKQKIAALQQAKLKDEENGGPSRSDPNVVVSGDEDDFNNVD